MERLPSLRTGGLLTVICACLMGALAAGLWVRSTAAWQAHLADAEQTGALLYEALQAGSEPPEGLTLAPLSAFDQALANEGRFDQLSFAPRPALVTHVALLPSPSFARPAASLTLEILSPDLRYPLAGLTRRAAQPPTETLAALTRLLATYCSTPQVIARKGAGPWLRVEGGAVWSCAAAPPDRRLIAALILALTLAVASTLVLNTSQQFSDFARALSLRRPIGGPTTYRTDGPLELREIVAAVNTYLARESETLAKRAAVLSGVSHDLGTPATRLRLRAALIADADLRRKFEADIDQMTGIIESVLTYTRAEMDAEEPRQISLGSLVESIVDDYTDMGSPVSLSSAAPVVIRGGQSLFMSRRGTGAMPEDRRIIVTARPVALTRAITNLVDNALKYGRRATVGVETDADRALISIEDEGTEMRAEDVEALIAPFQRGDNTQAVDGYGLGLTIAATVAALHGGGLHFEPGAKGLKATLTILRA